MQLVVVGESSQVVAVSDLEALLEHGSLAVRIDAVATLLAGIRQAAVAVTPGDATILETNPARMEQVAQAIMTVANAARSLAAAAPAGDLNAELVTATLDQLHVFPSEPSLVNSVVVDVTAPGPWYPALRFGEAGRVLGAYMVANATADFTVTVRNTGVDGEGETVTAVLAGSFVAGSAYVLPVETGGPELYGAGELLEISVETEATTLLSVQIDYQLASA